MTAVGVFGPGRAGGGIALGLARAGLDVLVHGRTRRDLPAELTATWGGLPPWIARVEVVVIAVPDDAIFGVARSLAAGNEVGPQHTVLHLSGVLDRSALMPLDASGAALGSLHPLQTFTDVEDAPARLQGAIATVEGDGRAVEVAETLARAVGMRPVRIESSAKVRYHAGAVFASNYVVAVAEIARQLLVEAGMPPESAWQGLQGLLRGTFESLAAGTPQDALTGPISRGDLVTVGKHLAVLSGEHAHLYRALGRVALTLADIAPAQRTEMEKLLHNSTPKA
ncbi:MAG: DUF2520 domain-containing protein [Gemmatimonadetes bacterium]|nr:DUF2520 domain-containing protein [Gemmatimonadota bacterium]